MHPGSNQLSINRNTPKIDGGEHAYEHKVDDEDGENAMEYVENTDVLAKVGYHYC